MSGRPAHQPLPSSEEIARLSPDGGDDFNRLIHETSPYLRQHARNPVNWHPWGEEAFEKARREDKPIFLSVGYSTCHWCHVMERESFESEEIARVLNEHFIPVKVDREERPDIDEIYMNVTQLMTGHGGWPNSVWLLPDGRAWYAGTYFPPEDRFGRPGFRTLLGQLARIWREQRKEVEGQAVQISEALRRMSASVRRTGEGSELSREPIQRAIDELKRAFDRRRGGFGGAPKFPPHGSLRLLVEEYRRASEPELLEMLTRTLDAMAQGGMHDQVGGGFHRYSTDEEWFLPHFEKMLYDNAQLAPVYVDAYLMTGKEDYRRVAVRIYEWVLREMTDARGGFYCALDADSEGEEGKFYLWSREEILDLLGENDGGLFCRTFRASEAGNYREEATGHRLGTSILHLEEPFATAAGRWGASPEEGGRRLDGTLEALRERRAKRIWPHLDDKVLTSWNGLMIGALAYGGKRLGVPHYVEASERAAGFVLENLQREGRLLRSYRDGKARLNAYLDDYAFLADGLLDLHEAGGEERWLKEAKGLVETMIRHCEDPVEGGFFFTSSDHEELLLRSKDPYDKAIPSGNGMAAGVLVRLGRITGEDRYKRMAEKSFRAFGEMMERAPRASERFLLALGWYLEAWPREPEAKEAGQEEPQPDARAKKFPVTVELFASRRRAAPGETVPLVFKASVFPGWHINAHRPGQDGLIGAEIGIGDDQGMILESVRYPEGKRLQVGFSDDPILVYEGAFQVGMELRIPKETSLGKRTLPFRLTAQACNEQRCVAPETLELDLPFEVVRGE
jgi:uncharacterized protein YyaL (SSP411 family)